MTSLVSFQSLWYIVFLVCMTVLFYTFKGKARKVVLLLGNVTFYIHYSWKAAIILCGYIILVYLFGLLMEKKNKWVMCGCVLVALIPLLLIKYISYYLSIYDIKLPIIGMLGVSYFTFKSIGYLADVYRGKISAERNFVSLALFVSFFAEILLGPIDRAGNLMTQINDCTKQKLTWDNLKKGILYLVWGYFLKLVIADRLGLLVDTVYSQPGEYVGFEVFVAAVCYSLQIFIDFEGCTSIVLGSGAFLGFKLPRNFRQPYLAETVTDFWRRWHISLTSWLRDYIYIPLGGNRKGIVRKYINILIVFVISGLWHGASLNFLFWGLLNGVLQVAEGLGKMNTDRSKQWFIRLIRRLYTFLMMTLAWMFFRASNISEAFVLIKSMFSTWNPQIFTNNRIFELGLSDKNIYVLLICLVIFTIFEVMKEKGIILVEWFNQRNFITQSVMLWIALFGIIILGIYGEGFEASSFIYIQF